MGVELDIHPRELSHLYISRCTQMFKYLSSQIYGESRI